MSRRNDDLVPPVVAAFSDAMRNGRRLAPALYEIDGFSGFKFRTFLNNLVAAVPDPRYLEIGLLDGATICSAIFRNRVKAVGVDMWVRGATPALCLENVAKYRNSRVAIDIVDRDFRMVDYTAHGPFNILFYDGPHRYEDQYDGVRLPLPAMDDRWILMVDDWNWDRVRKATFSVLSDAKLRIDHAIEVRTTFNGEPLPAPRGRTSEWNNGCFIGVLSKT